MGVARDIALIFLSLEALVVALIPLALVGGLAYGIFRLQKLLREYLGIAQEYAQIAHDYVEQASRTITEPLIRIHATARMVSAMFNSLIAKTFRRSEL